jgi:hypothetical protein
VCVEQVDDPDGDRKVIVHQVRNLASREVDTLQTGLIA